MTTILRQEIAPAYLKIVTFQNDYHLVLVERPKEVATEIAGFIDATI
jgi:hypothetical protein